MNKKFFFADKNDEAWARGNQKELLIPQVRQFEVREAYKSTRTNIMFTVSNEKCPIVMFTSAVQGEGKTTTCVNTAITMSQAGLRVLLIDADMRRPQIYKLFDLPHAPGLSDTLAGFEKPTIHSTPIENLSILTSGIIAPNPAELLMRNNFDLLLENMQEEYDFIFIDTPPIRLVTDAISVATRKISGTILVVRENFSHSDESEAAVSDLEQVNATVLGVILNNHASKEKNYRYKRYGKNAYDAYGGYGGYDSEELLENETNH